MIYIFELLQFCKISHKLNQPKARKYFIILVKNKVSKIIQDCNLPKVSKKF